MSIELISYLSFMFIKFFKFFNGQVKPYNHEGKYCYRNIKNSWITHFLPPDIDISLK